MTRIAGLVFVVVLAGNSVSATTLVPADFSQMVHESDVIVHGTVVNVQAQLAGSHRTIETVVTVGVADTIKGAATAQTMFRVPGGKIGRYRRVMVGAPQFTIGDEVILFLKGHAPAMPLPYGLSQGVYRVGRRDGVATVTPLIVPDGSRIVRGDPARRPLDPAAFAAQIRSVMAEVADAGAPPHQRAVPRAR